MVTKNLKKYLISRNTQLKRELLNIKTNITETNTTLTKIKSSKFYRLWRIYRYLIENF